MNKIQEIKTGAFVISLDFELFWGVRDKRTIENYGSNIMAVRDIIPRLLSMFQYHDIRATFATVGFLFFDSKKELMLNLPQQKPSYTNSGLSPFKYIDQIGESEDADKYHYAKSLIELIKREKIHEIASHTFSHYYCLEEGQTVQQFENDLWCAKTVVESDGFNLESLVFPRNQFNSDYLNVLKKMGFKSYRGNEHSWIYDPRKGEDESTLRRMFRLMDSYINLTGNHCFPYESIKIDGLYNIPASRFLRPYSPKLKHLESLRISRIKKAMTDAAKKQYCFSFVVASS